MKFILSILITISQIFSPTCDKCETSIRYDEPICPTIPHVQYMSTGRYYLDGCVIDNNGNLWEYYTNDYIADVSVYNEMPVIMVMDDNCTPDDSADDKILGLVYDRTTALVDTLAENYRNAGFHISRDGNEITILSSPTNCRGN